MRRRVRSMRGKVIASNSARVSSKLRRSAPSWSVIRAEVRSESAHLACSLRTRTSLRAIGSSSGSKPVSAANRSARKVAIRSSQFLPPRSWSPAVARMTISVGRDPGDGHVERAAAQVVDQHRLLDARLLQPVGQGRGGRLVDDPEDLEAGGVAGVDRRLALGVGEVGRHGDDGAVDRLAQPRPRRPPSADSGRSPRGRSPCTDRPRNWSWNCGLPMWGLKKLAISSLPSRAHSLASWPTAGGSVPK